MKTNNMSRPLYDADPEVAAAIDNEVRRQHEGLELIASENFVSEAVLEAAGSVFTNKYAEGYPGKRYYGGCEFTDVVENLARERVKKLFGAEHANVQPHSGSQANQAAYAAVLQPGDTILGLNLAHGGHLTHGHHLNFSGKTYKIVPYGVTKETETIDYDELEKTATAEHPKLIIGGGSAYPRIIDFARMRQIADKVGALFLVDMAHFAGLVAGGAHPSPVPHAHIVTSTTHKTLRGPRSGMILSKQEFAAPIDKTVFPGVQGGPLVHVVAAKAVCFLEAMRPEFVDYQKRVVANAQALARYAALCQESGLVPVVEPEVLMDGDHTLERCREVTEEVLRRVFDQLYTQRVTLEAMILKPNMVLPGLTCAKQETVDEVADATVRCLLRVVPAAVPGIAFLSGGQSGELASARLNAMHVRSKSPNSRLPWALAFSFARAIQQPALEIWRGEESHILAAQQALYHRASCNRAARRGEYNAAMERI